MQTWFLKERLRVYLAALSHMDLIGRTEELARGAAGAPISIHPARSNSGSPVASWKARRSCGQKPSPGSGAVLGSRVLVVDEYYQQ